jgi:hypothetical protein
VDNLGCQDEAAAVFVVPEEEDAELLLVLPDPFELLLDSDFAVVDDEDESDLVPSVFAGVAAVVAAAAALLEVSRESVR